MVKIERSFPAPESLAIEASKVSGLYNKPDVVTRLSQDSGNKCYICEIAPLSDPIVEHLLPHKNNRYPDRKFDWNNLFLACNHCNGVKNQKKYDDGIIDCCKVDPEDLINFRLEDQKVDVRAKEQSDILSVLTAELIQEVFSICNTGIRIIASDVRYNELNKEMNKLYDSLEAIKKTPDSKVLLRKIKALLSRNSAFAAFKRFYIRNNQDDYPQLLPYII